MLRGFLVLPDHCSLPYCVEASMPQAASCHRLTAMKYCFLRMSILVLGCLSCTRHTDRETERSIFCQSTDKEPSLVAPKVFL